MALHPDRTGDERCDLFDTRDKAPEKHAFCAMPVEKQPCLLEVIRLKKPDPIANPSVAVTAAQPVIEIVAKYRTSNRKPKEIAKVEVTARRQRTKQQ